MYRQIAPYVGRRVLEAGCGIGNLTELLLDADRLIASDIDPFYVEMIDRRFGHLENFRAVPMDLTRAEDYARLEGERPRHDHLPERPGAHRAPTRRCWPLLPRLLEPGGHAIILVPQHPWLYSADRPDPRPRPALHRGRAAAEARAGGLRGRPPAGVQPAGDARLVRQRQAPGQASTCLPARCGSFNRILPLAKLIERVPGWPALSTIAVGRKPR